MNTKKLKQLVLDLAIHGKLVPQDPNDEPASELLKRIVETHGRASNIGRASKQKKIKSAISSDNLDDVPFEVPEGWVWCRLGEIGKWQSGSTPSRSNKRFYGGDIPWLKTGDLNDGFITDIPEYITEEALKNTSVKLNPTDSVLIAMYGATIGKVGILTFPATTNQACCACSEYFLNKMYLFYFLIQERENFISKAGGGAQPNISKEIIVDTFIPLPPLSEQRRIVSEIEKWFGIIDQLESNEADLRKSIEQTKKKVLDLAIHGKLVPQDPNDEPASELLKRIVETHGRASNKSKGKKSAISSEEIDEVPFEVPKGWVWTTILDISEDDLGKTLDREKNKGNYKFYLRSANVLWNKFDFSDLKEMRFEDSELEFYSLKNGDLLICEGGDIGRAAVWDENKEMYFQNALHRLRFYNNINPYLFMYFLYYYKNVDVLNEYSQGVTIKHLTKTSLSRIPFPLPPLSEQRRIVAKIEEVFGELDRMLEMIG